MADVVANIAKGRAVEWYNRVEGNDPSTAGFVFVLLNTTATDDVLRGLDTLAAVEADGNTTEVGDTGYARVVYTDADLAALPAPDDTNDRYDIDLPDLDFGDIDADDENGCTKIGWFYAPDTGGADSTFLPVGFWDFTIAFDGSNVTAEINAAGAFRAS